MKDVEMRSLAEFVRTAMSEQERKDAGIVLSEDVRADRQHADSALIDSSFDAAFILAEDCRQRDERILRLQQSVKAARDEVVEVKAARRKAAQILVEEIGARTPEEVEETAARAVAQLQAARAEVGRLQHRSRQRAGIIRELRQHAEDLAEAAIESHEGEQSAKEEVARMLPVVEASIDLEQHVRHARIRWLGEFYAAVDTYRAQRDVNPGKDDGLPICKGNGDVQELVSLLPLASIGHTDGNRCEHPPQQDGAPEWVWCWPTKLDSGDKSWGMGRWFSDAFANTHLKIPTSPDPTHFIRLDVHERLVRERVRHSWVVALTTAEGVGGAVVPETEEDFVRALVAICRAKREVFVRQALEEAADRAVHWYCEGGGYEGITYTDEQLHAAILGGEK